MKKITLPTLFLTLPASFAVASDLYVPKQYETVQSAIDAAVAGDRILISGGVYSEKLVLPSIGIEIIGIEGPGATTIDAGGLEGSPISCIIDLKDPSEHSNDSVSGLTLTGGTGTVNPVWQTLQGGGMFIYNASPSVTNCVIVGNTSEFGGGGIWAQYSDSEITNVEFANNTVTLATRGGGGMYLWDCTATIDDCVFVNNTSDSGGGFKSKGGDSSTVINCDFIGNNTPQTGGGVACTSSTTVFEGCLFEGNAAEKWGGGAAVDFSNDGASFRSCVFVSNNAGISGGGLRVHEGSALVEKCVFSDNSGPYGGGGIVVNGNNSPGVCTVSGSTFENNDGGTLGGGIHHTYISSTDVDTSTFCGNVAVPITGNWNDLGNNSMDASCLFFCGGDIDANGLVNVEDILSLLSEWGPCDGITSCFSDQNDDGVVDVNDLLMLIANWGTCG